MKFVKSKCLQKCEGRKIGKYLITLEVTDSDIEQFEDIGGLPKCEIVTYKSNITGKAEKPDVNVPDKDRMKYMEKVFRVFQTLWKKYDKDD